MSSSFGQRVGVVRQQLDPELLLDAGRERVGAGQHEVDVDAARILLRLDLAGQLGRRRLGEGDARHELGLGLAVVLDGLLGQRQVAGDVDDVERHRRFRQRQLRLSRAAERGDAGRARDAADESTSAIRWRHVYPPCFCLGLTVVGPRRSVTVCTPPWRGDRRDRRPPLRLVLIQAMGVDEVGEIGAIDPARHVVAGGNRQIGAGVVVEADGVVEARRLGGSSRKRRMPSAVEEPPGGPEPQGRIMPGQRRELARIAGLVEGEEDDGQAGLVAERSSSGLSART